MTFDQSKIDLPIFEILPDLQEQLDTTPTVIVHAPPGAGKSTIIPLALLDHPSSHAKKILMLEPRRLAARSIAARMADLLGEQVGQTVGYRIRFDTRVSESTRIEVITEGILTRMLQSDNALEDVGLVIFDEFHERNIHSDTALAFCLDCQQVLRPDLRILIMSATLDASHIASLLKAPILESHGRQYPVEHIYTGQSDVRLTGELMSQAVRKALQDQDGDILCFLPGEAEIRACEELLKKGSVGASIHPLYGMLPRAAQDAAIRPDRKGSRKVVLATSIAETSLTIEGVSIVIDSGWSRSARFDPNTGLTRLETVRVSRDAADQRAGRAGRLGPGVCYRMWSLADQERLESHRQPEIINADLAPLMLDLANWGVTNPKQLTWITPPPTGHLGQAQSTLVDIEAIENGKITKHGKEIQRLPAHPRLAHMMLRAKDHDTVSLATDVAAVLEERDPLGREAGIDINLRVEALRKHREEKREGKRLARLERVAASYRRLFGVEEDNDLPDAYETGFLLAQAYPERIAIARPGNNAQFQLANGALGMASHKDELAFEEALAVAHMDAREGMGKIFLASPLNPRDLEPLVKEREIVRWNDDEETLQATIELRIGSIVLNSRPLRDPSDEAIEDALSQAILRKGSLLLDWNEDVTQWQSRVLSLRHWRPDDGWPDVSTSHLLQTAKEWLGPYFSQLRRAQDFKRLALLDILHHHLPYHLQQTLSHLAPTRIKVPSGSQVKLQYTEDGSPPVLAVRIQEVFGLKETPRVNEGRNAVLMHLLSPGFKPVQITSDLTSFWNDGFHEVKKELKRRYPKHSWPEDPWEAEAIRGVKRRTN